MVKPWYKQFWPWFLLAFPIVVITSSLYRVYILSQHSVSLVTEDYYKKGKGINIDITKLSEAKAFGLSASVSSHTDGIVIQFNKGKLDHFPAIKAEFAHRTLPDRDFSQLLTSDSKGNYRLRLDSPIQGPWFVKLLPHDEQWLIQGKVTFPSKSPTLLAN